MDIWWNYENLKSIYKRTSDADLYVSGCVWNLFVIFDLYHIDLACVEYAFLLSGVWSLLYAVLGFVRYRRTHRELQNVIKGEKEQILEFAEGTTLLEQDYQKLVQKLYTQINETESEQAIERQDMLDYYSMWAHQIKTPIAAMNLLLQTEKEEHPVLVRELEMELFKIQQYVEMVLTYLRMEDMSADLSFAVCDLDTVIRQVVRQVFQDVYFKENHTGI